jgi:hypothetical protein
MGACRLPRGGLYAAPRMDTRWRLRSWFKDVEVVVRLHATREEGERAIAPRRATFLLDRWLRDAWCRPQLERIFRTLSGPYAGRGDGRLRSEFDQELRASLTRAFERRELLVLDTDSSFALPLVSVESPANALGPKNDDPLVDKALDDWFRCIVFESSGEPLKGESLVVSLADGSQRTLTTNAQGIASIEAIPSQPASACAVDLTLFTREDALPLDAPAAGDPDISAAMVRAPLDGPHKLRWMSRTAPLPMSLNATYVFQFDRRTAAAIELEHFDPDGAVMLPGLAPIALRMGARITTGLSALRAVLGRIESRPGELPILTGHHASLSEERAKSVLFLLMRNRAEWAKLSHEKAGPNDADHILRWAAAAHEWRCNPDVDPKPVLAFRNAYNDAVTRRRGAKHRIASTAVDAAMWGAFFDLYDWALWPEPDNGLPFLVVNNHTTTYPLLLSDIATGTEAHYRDLYPINPTFPLPDGTGWRSPEIGETIYLPRDPVWDLEKLRAAHYDVFSPAPATALVEPTSPAVVKPITYVGCGARHATHPHAKAPRRRGEARAVEVLFFSDANEPGRIARADEASTTQTDDVYDPRRVDVFYLELENARAPIRHATLWVILHGRAIPGLTLVIANDAGETSRHVTDERGEVHVEGIEGEMFHLHAIFDGDQRLPPRAFDMTYSNHDEVETHA